MFSLFRLCSGCLSQNWDRLAGEAEILAWLNENCSSAPWLAIDDLPLELPAEHVVRTDPFAGPLNWASKHGVGVADMEKGCNELSSSYFCEQVAVKEKSRVPHEPKVLNDYSPNLKVSKSLSSSAVTTQSKNLISKTVKTRNETEQAFKRFEVQFFFVQLESCANVFCVIVDFPRDHSTFKQFGIFGVLEYLRWFVQILAWGWQKQTWMKHLRKSTRWRNRVHPNEMERTDCQTWWYL